MLIHYLISVDIIGLSRSHAFKLKNVLPSSIDKVREEWLEPEEGQEGDYVVVTVSLHPNGALTDMAVARSSGKEAFDHSALEAIRRAQPFYELQGLDLATFEREFQSFTFVFRPED